jgi:hypothetical protein
MGEVSLPFAADFLWVGDRPSDLVVGRGSDETIAELAWVDCRGQGSVRALPTPMPGLIHKVVSLEGTSELALSVSDGREEGFDGQFFTLVRWNYKSGSWRVLIDNAVRISFIPLIWMHFGADLSSYGSCFTQGPASSPAQ